MTTPTLAKRLRALATRWLDEEPASILCKEAADRLEAAERVCEVASEFHGCLDESDYTRACKVCQAVAAYRTAAKGGEETT